MNVHLRIRRLDPTRAEPHYWSEHDLEMPATATLLDALHVVRADLDPTLGFRRSCGMGICGSDAMQVNGRNCLACKALLSELGNEITVEPLKGLQPVRDLVVDMAPFFDNLKSIKPWLLPAGPAPYKERLQSPEQRERFDDTTKCILCAACTTSCPPFWNDPSFVGPAAIVNAHRFIYDSRDTGVDERMDKLTGEQGIYRCRTVFNCTACCPRDIKITDAIGQLKRLYLERSV